MVTILQRLLIISLLFYSNLSCASSKNIVILGDSISAAYGINTVQGWTSLLQTRLKKQGYAYRIINASVSGDTTRTGLNRLGPILRQHHPEIIIVALGGNDGLRGIPFKEIRNSLSEIIRLSEATGSKVILAGVRLPPNYGALYNTRFSQLYQELTQRYEVTLVPALLNNVSEHSHLMQADGIHPTASAQPIILENIWLKLQPLLRHTKAQK